MYGRGLRVADAVTEDRLIVKDMVKRFDRDRYWAALFAPEPVRTHLLTLYAFNVELSRIPEQVKDPMTGELRLQWWRDALAQSRAGDRTGHPIADALAKTRIGYGLSEALLLNMVDARLFDIKRELMRDMTAMRTYLTRTAGVLFYLAARITGARTEDAEKACENAGLAYGLTGLLRALPYHASRGQLFLPAEHFTANNVDPYSLLRGEEKPELGEALAGLRAAAQRHLAAFRLEAVKLPPETLPVFLPLALIEPYLERLARQDHPMRHIADIIPIYKYWLILRAWQRGHI